MNVANWIAVVGLFTTQIVAAIAAYIKFTNLQVKQNMEIESINKDYPNRIRELRNEGATHIQICKQNIESIKQDLQIHEMQNEKTFDKLEKKMDNLHSDITKLGQSNAEEFGQIKTLIIQKLK